MLQGEREELLGYREQLNQAEIEYRTDYPEYCTPIWEGTLGSL